MTHDTDMDNLMNTNADEDDLTCVERLIERLIDADGSCDRGNAWDEFRALAARDHRIWQQLAEAQQAHRTMCAELERALEPALRVSLPISLPDTGTHAVSDGHLGWMRRHAGWAAAVAVAVLWGGSTFVPTRSPQNNRIDTMATNTASPSGAATTEVGTLASGSQASAVSGDLIGRTKPVLLDMRRRPDGTMEVVYGHWIVERSQVDQFYNRQWDETGRPIDTPQPEVQAVPANFW